MKRKGFTLIELMIVVAIIGVLAAIAIPSFLRFITKSKKSEISLNLRAITNGSISWYHAEHTDTAGDPMERHFPGTAAPTGYASTAAMGEEVFRPDALPCGSLSAGALYVKNSQNWNSQPWLALKFSITKAHYGFYGYRVRHDSDPSRIWFAASAGIDLDCDGQLEVFTQEGSIDNQTNDVLVTQLYYNASASDETH